MSLGLRVNVGSQYTVMWALRRRIHGAEGTQGGHWNPEGARS